MATPTLLLSRTNYTSTLSGNNVTSHQSKRVKIAVSRLDLCLCESLVICVFVCVLRVKNTSSTVFFLELD